LLSIVTFSRSHRFVDREVVGVWDFAAAL
jgi:hypothetical protein